MDKLPTTRSNPTLLEYVAARLYGWACERLYHEFAWSYDAISCLVSAGRWNAWRRAALAHVMGPSVLELGFGTGDLLIQLAGQYRHVHGIDLSPQMHNVAAKKVRRFGQSVQRCRAQAENLPYADASFNTIVSTFPAPYILEPSTLHECARVLVPSEAHTTDELSRLVIIGLWVTPRTARWLQHIPVFFGQPDSASIQQLAQPFLEAGLRPTFKMVHDTWADVSVTLAERVT